MKNNSTPGRPKTTTDDFRRWCVIMRNDQIEKIREIAVQEGLTMKDVVTAALKSAIDRYEQKNGPVVITKKKNIDNLF